VVGHRPPSEASTSLKRDLTCGKERARIHRGRGSPAVGTRHVDKESKRLVPFDHLSRDLSLFSHSSLEEGGEKSVAKPRKTRPLAKQQEVLEARSVRRRERSIKTITGAAEREENCHWVLMSVLPLCNREDRGKKEDQFARNRDKEKKLLVQDKGGKVLTAEEGGTAKAKKRKKGRTAYSRGDTH